MNKEGGLPGLYGSTDPTMDVPVTASQGASVVSPYLNFNPAYIGPSQESQFIFPEGASQRRGRFELAFSQIGSSVLIGGALGGLNGFYKGLQETQQAQLTGAVQRTQLINFIAKRGASSAQTLGVVALMYSLFGVILSKSRGEDDSINTLAAATATGLLYKSSAGWKKCARAGGIGFGMAAVYCLWSKRDELKNFNS